MRDQYRRVVKKRKYSQTKQKWRYEDIMKFLEPYFRERKMNPDSFNNTVEEDDATENIITFDDEEDSSILTSTNILEDPFQLKEKNVESDPLNLFFVAMAETVKTFPAWYQHIAKNRVFNVVSGLEMEILQSSNSGGVSSNNIEIGKEEPS